MDADKRGQTVQLKKIWRSWHMIEIVGLEVRGLFRRNWVHAIF